MMPWSAAAGHPSSPLTGQSMCLINQRHAIGKQALHRRSADTLIYLTSSHNSIPALPDLVKPHAYILYSGHAVQWTNTMFNPYLMFGSVKPIFSVYYNKNGSISIFVASDALALAHFL